ncbi:Uu.00g025940.m01.CDS01 [Anthostomella pinea]|uniref:Uu.00g025940.m01.CDS01 n=1 Tax=Anthostomella pinea TaxID=933095 RepID=A0AAI8YCG6_9PEZI|nr:Uu.00g025940.m01.CDS01 [Anthostomella pinea]
MVVSRHTFKPRLIPAPAAQADVLSVASQRSFRFTQPLVSLMRTLNSETPGSQFLNLLTFGLWGKLGRLTHYAVDAVLISTILAGMRRSTGLTLKSEQIAGENNKEVNKWVGKYLSVGEWVMDTSVAFAGSSGFFERKR